MIMLSTVLALSAMSAGSVVKLDKTATGVVLTVNGAPYNILGAGCSNSDEKYLDMFAASGGNSIRTWGVGDDTQGLLDRAHKKGVSVTVGYWLGHVAHGFNWSDQSKLNEQFEGVRNAVRKYKDHPAVLMWALGNEMEVGGNNTPTLWKEVGRLAKMVKEEDPNHPVTAVVADADQKKIDLIKQYAPDIDILGVNSYGGLKSLPTRLKSFGWTKPFMVTEFGPAGQWEVPKTDWDVSVEPTSTDKAEMYRSNYLNSIKAHAGWCLGSYAFIWGNKQEETATWFGMLLPTGEKLESAEVMSEFWSGKAPANRAPRIQSAKLGPDVKIGPEGQLTLGVRATDPEDDKLQFEYVVRLESTDKKPGGYPENAPATLLTIKSAQPSFKFLAPKYPGMYRVFVYIRDGKGNAATANVPFLVK